MEGLFCYFVGCKSPKCTHHFRFHHLVRNSDVTLQRRQLRMTGNLHHNLRPHSSLKGQNNKCAPGCVRTNQLPFGTGILLALGSIKLDHLVFSEHPHHGTQFFKASILNLVQ